MATQEEAKAKANELFKQHKFEEAIEAYTEALKFGDNAILFSNRAYAWIKLDMMGAAMEDAQKAINTDPNYAKGYFRRATARYSLGKYKLALNDFKIVCKMAPKDRGARERMKECDKLVKKIAFEKAIEAEETKLLSELINIDDISIESDYSGIDMPWPLTRDYVKAMMNEFKERRTISRKHVIQMLLAMKDVLTKEPSLVDVSVPEEKPDTEEESDLSERIEEGHVVVWGDIHGQYYDMLNIFSKVGLPKKGRRMIFNGDFVDRGSFSCEVVITLFAWKLLYPDLVHLNRGNHETTNMNRVYGFSGEVKSKYGEKAYDLFREIFNYLPLCHVVDKKVFVVHGGLFQKDDVKLDDIRAIKRYCEPSDPSLMADLMWSDPQFLPGRSPSKRGIGLSFGPDVTENFLKLNDLKMVIRSHEVKHDGYEVMHNGKCITVFSAPNYCDEVGNKAAVVRLTKGLEPKFMQFTHVEHPAVKPMQYAGFNPFM